MTGSVALDVVIGLVFIFLLYSLLATTLQEMLATMLSFRAKVLEKAILRMLHDDHASTNWRLWLVSRLSSYYGLIFRKNNLKGNFVAAAFYNHPLLKFYGENNMYSKPAYLSPQSFSKVMIELLSGINVPPGEMQATEIASAIRQGKVKDFLTVYKVPKQHPISAAQRYIQKYVEAGGGAIHYLSSYRSTQEAVDLALMERDELPKYFAQGLQSEGKEPLNYLAINSETRMLLQSMWNDARGDVDRFRGMIEQWFDDTMQRTTGWYKRYVRSLLFVIGFLLAVGFNVDTIGIARKLSRDPNLSRKLADAASAYVQENKELENRIDAIRSQDPVPAPQENAAQPDEPQRSKIKRPARTKLKRSHELTFDSIYTEENAKLGTQAGAAQTRGQEPEFSEDKTLKADARKEKSRRTKRLASGKGKPKRNSGPQSRAALAQEQPDAELSGDSTVQETRSRIADNKQVLRDLDSQRRELMTHIQDANQMLGLGWTFRTLEKDSTDLKKDSAGAKKQNAAAKANAEVKKERSTLGKIIDENHIGWSTLVGWLITALAVSLGAPFWFDLLSKLVKLRGVVPRPSSSSAQTTDSKDQNAAGGNPSAPVLVSVNTSNPGPEAVG